MSFSVIPRIPPVSFNIASENSPSRNSPRGAADKLRLKEVSMKKILIISDTHRRDDVISTVMRQVGHVDMMIHAGDAEGSEEVYHRIMCAENGDFHYVAGNNDFFTRAPQEDLFYIGPYRTYLTHGHQFCVSMGDKYLRDEAWQNNVNILIYGHTHRPVAEYEGPMLVLNPGSLTYPRQANQLPSYILLTLDENDRLQYEIHYLD